MKIKKIITENTHDDLVHLSSIATYGTDLEDKNDCREEIWAKPATDNYFRRSYLRIKTLNYSYQLTMELLIERLKTKGAIFVPEFMSEIFAAECGKKGIKVSAGLLTNDGEERLMYLA